ncbi:MULTISPECIES: 3-dehydroquinate synthase II [Methanothermobacter]|uniref:3-dehydroquinate synthase n=3 Tax=Methanothermobacter thermautotrophicus TaxID=145262 RepID=DHQS_METTH|nr:MULTISPECIES: 3-dehydroquinate synthase II [Methanothermobacter]O26680.2 RecName: Full=3-dehydroquinate synthase; Short=DHQ synthase; AltName: Full=3-dehydroquinate synthase II [Methanothermobacter thermautotrophicus str. Delta H]MBC7110920.1 3-dehydroquinate synthase II [Methanothermobacter sp.]MDI6817894.1 3-dehydroquinate synthase II [Methanothermobacter thermautotrophicus]WBF06828.1 3-dehydroquinate synthase II [Methanothermobacter thermautotrophicus]WBF08623.1 3-dehydroquinate synthase
MKFAWLLAPDTYWDEKKTFITAALESGIDHIVDTADSGRIKKLGNLTLISPDEDADIVLVGRDGEGDGTLELPETLEYSRDIEMASELSESGRQVAAYVEIRSKAHEELARRLGRVVDYLILVGEDWKIIPLENIIADLQEEDVKLIAAVADVDEARVALETLEHGTDGVLIEPADISQIKDIAALLENIESETYELKPATITRIEPIGSGDRVCVDTCSIMGIGEGMLVGSYSQGLFLVHSESLESEYVASRPFRVNAGPVQAYVMVPGGRTRYLSELETGDEVIIVDRDGRSRSAIVGRVKIEKRPLMLVEAEYEGMKVRTLLQNAETIRLVNDKGEPVSVSELGEGDRVLVYFDESARHFGMAIKETIIEK